MSSSTTSPTAVVDVTMPQLGVSVSEGTVVAWRKRPGDAVAYEETICEIATDKIDVECPAPRPASWRSCSPGRTRRSRSAR